MAKLRNPQSSHLSGTLAKHGVLYNSKYLSVDFSTLCSRLNQPFEIRQQVCSPLWFARSSHGNSTEWSWEGMEDHYLVKIVHTFFVLRLGGHSQKHISKLNFPSLCKCQMIFLAILFYFSCWLL